MQYFFNGDLGLLDLVCRTVFPTKQRILFCVVPAWQNILDTVLSPRDASSREPNLVVLPLVRRHSHQHYWQLQKQNQNYILLIDFDQHLSLTVFRLEMLGLEQFLFASR